MSARLGALALWGASGLCGAACSGPSYTFDEKPIALLRAGGDAQTAGALLALGVESGRPLNVLFDTGSPLTFFGGAASAEPRLTRRSFALVDGQAGVGATSPVRGILDSVGTLTVPISPLSDGTQPDVILGGDIFRGFSVELSFSKSTTAAATFWSRQGASDDALAAAGFSVLHATLYGGTEISALGEKDWLGMRGPLYVSPSRVVLRTCGNPPAFSELQETPPLTCCHSKDPNPRAGADLSLVLATGLGPVVLSETAWRRLETAYAQDLAAGVAPSPLPPLAAGPDLQLATSPAPIPARWSSLPRLALVDLQTSAARDPGPCVELARARRIEWAEAKRAMGSDTCFAACDQDTQDSGRTATTAAHLEVTRTVPVAVVPDISDLLQGVRAEIRPEGPEVDGFIGAGVLDDVHLEIDYRSSPARAIFACEANDRATCFSAPRCAGTSPNAKWRSCFGLVSPPEKPPSACFLPRC